MVLVVIALGLSYVSVRRHVTYRRIVVVISALVVSSLVSVSLDNNVYAMFTDSPSTGSAWVSALLLLLPLMIISVRFPLNGDLLRRVQVPAVIVVAAALVMFGWSVDPADPYNFLYPGLRSVLEEGRARSSPGRRYLIEGGNYAASALLFDLNGRGRILTYEVFANASLNHEPSGHRCDKVLTVQMVPAGKASPTGAVRRLRLHLYPNDPRQIDLAFQVRADDSPTGRY